MPTLYYTSVPPLPISSLLTFLPPLEPTISIREVPQKSNRPYQHFIPHRGAFIDCPSSSSWHLSAQKLNGVSWKGS